ncbi:hypothetical protein [uncultured Amnibacterium sp.]|uniref:hypothetical protein n=1 Tax=uncultured Amnibacterium sp. TaxID=1631851 RepID=UPI0035C9EE25
MIRILRRPRRPEPAAALDEVADCVARAAALIGAGATPAAAGRYLAAHLGTERERSLALAALAGRARPSDAAVASSTAGDAHGHDAPAGDAPADDAGAAWQRVGVVVALAVDVGAPLAATLHRTAEGLRAAADLHRSIRQGVAGPAASARVMLFTPVAALLMAWGFGFDVPGAFTSSPLAGSSAAVAVLLLLVARRWQRRLTAAASAVPWQRGLGIELVAVGVRAGLPTDAAIQRASRHAGAEAALTGDRDDIAGIVRFATEAGVPLAGLLDAESRRIRTTLLAEAGRRSAALAVQLLLPLGSLVLPAFILLGVVPIGLAVLSSTSLQLA